MHGSHYTCPWCDPYPCDRCLGHHITSCNRRSRFPAPPATSLVPSEELTAFLALLNTGPESLYDRTRRAMRAAGPRDPIIAELSHTVLLAGAAFTHPSLNFS